MIWRVVVSFTFNGLSFMVERGAIASSPGDALNATLNSVRADRADTLRVMMEPAPSLACFSHEASALPLVNGQGQTVREAFQELDR